MLLDGKRDTRRQHAQGLRETNKERVERDRERKKGRLMSFGKRKIGEGPFFFFATDKGILLQRNNGRRKDKTENRKSR